MRCPQWKIWPCYVMSWVMCVSNLCLRSATLVLFKCILLLCLRLRTSPIRVAAVFCFYLTNPFCSCFLFFLTYQSVLQLVSAFTSPSVLQLFSVYFVSRKSWRRLGKRFWCWSNWTRIGSSQRTTKECCDNSVWEIRGKGLHWISVLRCICWISYFAFVAQSARLAQSALLSSLCLTSSVCLAVASWLKH